MDAKIMNWNHTTVAAESQQKALPELSRHLLRQVIFMNSCYRDDYNLNVQETKRVIKEDMVILKQRACPVREEADEGEGEAAKQPEPQPNRRKQNKNRCCHSHTNC